MENLCDTSEISPTRCQRITYIDQQAVDFSTGSSTAYLAQGTAQIKGLVKTPRASNVERLAYGSYLH